MTIDPRIYTACLSDVLGRDSLATTPEAYAAHGGESEEDAEVCQTS